MNMGNEPEVCEVQDKQEKEISETVLRFAPPKSSIKTKHIDIQCWDVRWGCSARVISPHKSVSTCGVSLFHCFLKEDTILMKFLHKENPSKHVLYMEDTLSPE